MGENGRPIRVNDPVLRWLVGFVGALASWALIQVNEHGKILAAMAAKQGSIEETQKASEHRHEMSIVSIRGDLQQIRSALEKRP